MEWLADLTIILAATARAATPLLLAGLGELITEKTGVLNLGVEGMMLMGAVAGFATSVTTGSLYLGCLIAMLCGALVAFLFAVLTLFLRVNQVAAGLALTIFCTGLSAFVGLSYIGKPLKGFLAVPLSGLSEIPFLGPVLFNQDVLVYFSWFLALAVFLFFRFGRLGLCFKAVGESHDVAHKMGYSVLKIRLVAVLVGGALAGLGGAYLSLAYTPLWTENMVAGRGWIAIVLVVFATWRVGFLLLGAYLFGGVALIPFFVQGAGYGMSPQLLNMAPYVCTILVLAFVSHRNKLRLVRAPADLGKIFDVRD